MNVVTLVNIKVLNATNLLIYKKKQFNTTYSSQFVVVTFIGRKAALGSLPLNGNIVLPTQPINSVNEATTTMM